MALSGQRESRPYRACSCVVLRFLGLRLLLCEAGLRCEARVASPQANQNPPLAGLRSFRPSQRLGRGWMPCRCPHRLQVVCRWGLAAYDWQLTTENWQLADFCQKMRWLSFWQGNEFGGCPAAVANALCCNDFRVCGKSRCCGTLFACVNIDKGARSAVVAPLAVFWIIS